MDRLEDRCLDLGEAPGVQRVAHAAHDRSALVGHGARVRPHDQVDVPHPDACVGIGQAQMLVGQGPQRLAGQPDGLGANAQLALVRRDHLAGYAHVVAEVDVVLPERQGVGVQVLGVDHHLKVAAAVAQGGEPEPAHVPLEQDPADDRDRRARLCVRRQVRELGPHLGQRVGARRRCGIGVDAPLAEQVDLAASNPDLLGQVLGGHRFGDDVPRRHHQREHRRGVLGVGPVEAGVVVP